MLATCEVPAGHRVRYWLGQRWGQTPEPLPPKRPENKRLQSVGDCVGQEVPQSIHRRGCGTEERAGKETPGTDADFQTSSLETDRARGRGRGNRPEDTSHPELVVISRGALLDEGPIVGGNVAVVRVFFQHVDLLFDLFFLVLGEWEAVSPFLMLQPSLCPKLLPTSVTSMTLMAASCPVLTCRPCRQRQA